jgi:hypothetical protein
MRYNGRRDRVRRLRQRRLTYVDLYGTSFVVPELQLARYWANKQRLAFLRDIIDRAAILEHCFESLNQAAVAADIAPARIGANS